MTDCDDSRDAVIGERDALAVVPPEMLEYTDDVAHGDALTVAEVLSVAREAESAVLLDGVNVDVALVDD